MSVEITTLRNGLRIVTHQMPHLETASLGMWVASGARNERKVEHGVSHFLEHMAFKGTKRRSAQRIAEEIENVGGDLNAATSLETTSYFARVLRADVGVALDILADILQDSQFASDEMEREREVILQEIASSKDSPDELAYDLMQDGAFPGQPVGRPILGTIESVKSLGERQLRTYLAENYGARSMVLSAAGAVRHADVVRQAEGLFGGLQPQSTIAAEPARYQGGFRHLAKPFEQNHLILAYESPAHDSPDFYAAQVMSGLFGGGMSSRLFQEARERRGLCYAIYSFAWGLSDTGIFGVHAATGPEQRLELMEVICNEFKTLASEAPSDAEVRRSKAQIKAGILMSLESSGSRAEQMARQILAYGRTIEPAELIEKVEAVTGNDIRNLASHLAAGPATVSEVGAGAQSADWQNMMASVPRAA
jgi:predicted Zn-dependent peptidase